LRYQKKKKEGGGTVLNFGHIYKIGDGRGTKLLIEHRNTPEEEEFE
jgi:hypothetical protein